ncbi:hypothetical protein LSCM1_05708 [Leishmania martiniquensis]|uniref:ubiquitinyl hydrolase 1 n=1 Tax=Leishmania martiniquensis TaxID=1580590 RepID=A0A836HD96_9TRYP|nr:hypothetical protein LSCM1_05708 [Leishmania martiniquensis]
MNACVTKTAPAAQLGASDLWASEVLEGCARAHCTPRQDLLGMLAPPSRATAGGATPLAAAASSEGGGEPHKSPLDPIEHPAPCEEMRMLRAALPPALLRKAYRLQMPCITKHKSEKERLLNCAASPHCMAGLQLLGSDAAAREDCLKAMMGDGPYVVPLPKVRSSSTTAASVGAASSLPASPAREQGAARATKSSRGDSAEGERRATAAGDAAESSVMSDPTFPCLWRGVRNLMNTCYFSSVLQLIFSITYVRRAILNDDATGNERHYVTVSEAQGSTGADQLAESGLKELFALMAFSREGAGADPQSFATYLSLDVKVQQDAQEFFTLLLDWLQCHCGPSVKAAVTRTFSGTLLYDRRCGACGRSAKRAEPFLYLSLPVCSTLEESLSQFSKPEAVDGFMCDKCGQTAVATSLQYIRTLPDVLVIHWNRFEFDVHTLQRHKVTTTSSFPLQLDMATYMRQWHEQKQSSTSTPAGGDGAAPEETEIHYLYELRGVVNHLGDTAVSGHYTYHGKVSITSAESCNSGSSWLNFNDAEVSRLNRYQGQRGTSPDAYLLVYHRIATPSSSPNSASLLKPSSTGNPPQPQHLAAAPPTSATPTPAEYPVYLRQYVDRVNEACLAKRRDWVEQRAKASTLFDEWATAAKAVFESGAAAPSPPAWISTAATTQQSLYVLPTRWLQNFGRFFLPAYVDAAALGGGAESQLKRNKKDSDTIPGSAEDDADLEPASGAAGIGASLIAAESQEDTSDSRCGAAVEGTVVTATAGPLRHGHMRTAEEVRQQVRQCSLLNAMPALTCAHGYLSPWASYKLVSASAFAKLARFLALCGVPLTTVEDDGTPASAFTAGASQTARFGESVAGYVAARDAPWNCAITDTNMCPLCATAMAAGVQALASRTAEDEEAERSLTRAWEEAERWKRHTGGEEGEQGSSDAGLGAATPAAGTQNTWQHASEDGQQRRVLVSETVVEAWASFYASQLRWSRVREAEGYTGVLVMREACMAPPPAATASTSSIAAALTALASSASSLACPTVPETLSTSLMNAGNLFSLTTLNVDRGDLNLSAQVLCPHGVLRPGQHLLAIPDSLRRYWMRRFVEVLTMAHRSGSLRTSNPHWSVSEDDVERLLLPLIPASEASTTCPECMRSSVQHLTSRHQRRMKRMEERKRYPSLWLAGAMTSPAGVSKLLLASGAENEEQLLAAQHPNRLFFKQHGEREYREYVRNWTESHQQRVALQSSEVQRLHTALEKKRQHDASWNARVKMRRRGGGQDGGRGERATGIPPAPTALPPPDPQTLEGRLYYAEEALEKMKLQTVPDYTITYGCVPTWWVAQWYAAMQSEDIASGISKDGDDVASDPLLALPRISFDKFKCAHCGSLLEVSWLNPSDSFWQGARAKRAELLWCGMQIERAGASSAAAPCTGPTAAEHRSQCWLPPMVILPMDEYVAVLTQYGKPGMLARATSTASVSMGVPAAEATVGGAEPHAEVTDVDAEAAEGCAGSAESAKEQAKPFASINEDRRVASPAAVPVAKARAQTVPIADAVVQVRFHKGARELVPSACAPCCAAMLADFDAHCESFVNGSLRLNIHVKKSRKNYYDAVSVLTSAAVQHTGGSNAAAAGTAAIPAGIHYYTTLGQLKVYISAHLRERHGYLVPAEALQVSRGKGKPLKRRSPLLQATEASGEHPCGTASEDASLDDATLQELGIRDGETLSVQSVDAIAQTCATTATLDEEWEAIPPELLQAGACSGTSAAPVFREHTVAFRETRLQGSHGGSVPAASAVGVAAATPSPGISNSVEVQGVSCAVCTFFNAPGMVVCEMCEAPLPSA